jgi:hypothetical protein
MGMDMEQVVAKKKEERRKKKEENEGERKEIQLTIIFRINEGSFCNS